MTGKAGGDLIVMYPYITLSDETEITHSQIIEDGDVQKSRNILSAPQSTVLTPHDVSTCVSMEI